MARPFDVPKMQALQSEEQLAAQGQGNHTQDQWTFLDFKTRMAKTTSARSIWSPPRWVGDHARRLLAYTILDAYYRNDARQWMNPEIELEDLQGRREYGDPYVIVESTLSSLLGDGTRVVVKDAVSEPPKTQDPQAPDAQPGENQPDAALIKAAKDLQKAMDKWADKEKLFMKMRECERNSMKLGDGVYVLGWDDKKKRPTLQVWDPGFYFPDLDARNHQEDFAGCVYMAYEYEQWHAKDQKTKKYIRRLKWELVPHSHEEYDPSYEADGTPLSAPKPEVPWNSDADQNCWLEDKTWEMDSEANSLDWFMDRPPIAELSSGQWLGIDFIPIIHMPTTWNAGHYGVSVLAPVLQVFDDLVNNDTDLQSAAALVATPIIGVGNAQLPTDENGRVMRYGPGDVIETGDGDLDIPDTSRSLDALLKYDDTLLGKMTRNARVPKTLLGVEDPSKVPSGVVLTLSYAPHSSLIREMRELRADKYRLMMRFVMRLYWKFGEGKDKLTWSATEDEPQIDILFGSYLPADRTEVSGIVTALLNAHGMSEETAVRMLVEAGYPIDDIEEEIRRIREQNMQKANDMLDATGDPGAVRKRLGLKGEPPTPPTPQGGGAPGNNGGTGPPAPPGGPMPGARSGNLA